MSRVAELGEMLHRLMPVSSARSVYRFSCLVNRFEIDTLGGLAGCGFEHPLQDRIVRIGVENGDSAELRTGGRRLLVA